MTINIRNQKPAILYDDPYNILLDINADKSEDEYADAKDKHLMETYIEPLFVPINSQHPVVIEAKENGQTQQIDKDAIFQGINHLWTSPTLDVDLQDQMNEIYRQGIQYLAPNDWYFEEQLGVEALTKMKLPTPSSKSGRIVRYTASVDLIPSAKQLLAQNDAVSATNWFANVTGYTHDRPFNNYLLLTVQTSDVFEDIKQHIRNYTQIMQTQYTIDADVTKLLSDFDKISLKTDLSAGMFMPNGGGSCTKEFESLSFTRIIMYAFSQYEKANHGKLLVQPTNINQLYLPENIIIMNLENYAHAKPSEIKDDWDTFEKGLNAKIALNFVSNKKLMTAKSMSRTLSQMSVSNSAGTNQQFARAKVKAFSGKPVPAKTTMLMMKKVIQAQITNRVTENTYKTFKTSYMRPNRRKPDDINLPGKLTTTKYRPDIHVYLDTSGSISETQYRDAVTNLIMLTKQINCNLYMTSFSHYVSQTTLLKTKDRTTQDIYAQFIRTPKVTGGTDFEQVWRKIDMIDEFNTKNGKSHQINFIITDYGYSLSRGHRWSREQASLKHTYYVPISANKATWEHILRYATNFRKQMAKAGDFGIRSRMLM